MCGICGVVMTDGATANAAQAQAMAGALRHRGPDGLGTWSEGPAALGHTRLSILDVSEAGAQPMADDSGRFRITFNGEIYNFLEIRAELEAAGDRFRTGTDTEVILAAYRRWGEECQSRFNGMWAFAIWDRSERRLFLSRDRFGVKPLHWWFDGTRFAFASEMKALLHLPGFTAGFDANSVATAILHSHRLEGTEACLLAGVRRLPPGHCLDVTAGNRHTPVVRRWWNTLDHVAGLDGSAVEGSFAEQAEQVRALFLDACRIRMRSDVPVATALSGGLDSSAVHVGLAHLGRREPAAARTAPDWQRAFVACFPDDPQDERSYADAVIAKAGTTGIHLRIDPAEAVAHAEDMVFAIEDITENIAAPWLLYRAMRREGVVVSIDGHGGDELFGGYVHQVEAAIAETPDGSRRKAMRAIRAAMAPPASPTTNLPEGFTRAGFLRQKPVLPELPTRTADLSRFGRFDPLTRCCYADIHFTTLPTILRNFDRVSMAHGVEVRTPFLDWRLVTLALGLPADRKVGDGFSKRILRAALGDLLPPVVRDRRSKLGFVTPVYGWRNSPFAEYTLDLLHGQDFRESDIWDGPALLDAVVQGLQRGFDGVLWHVWPFVHACLLARRFAGETRACDVVPEAQA